MPGVDYNIDKWLFRVAEQCLCDGENTAQLTPSQSDILLALVMSFPEPVSSEKLLGQHNKELALSRNKLYQSIAKLRRVFNDSVHKANFIETVPKKGYRLTITPELVVPESATADLVAGTKNDKTTDTPAIAKDTVNRSVDVGIFDDLSFIDAKSESKDIEPISEQDAVLAEPSGGSSAKALADTAAADTQPPMLAAKFVKDQRWWLLIFSLLLAILMINYSFPTKEPVVVEKSYPELLYVSDITFAVDDGGLPQKITNDVIKTTNANLHWWLKQGLARIPLIKIIASRQVKEYPLLTTHLTYTGDSLTIQQRYYVESESEGEALSLHQLRYNGSIASGQVFPELIAKLVGDVSISANADSCTFSQLSSNRLDLDVQQSSGCLVEDNNQLINRLSTLSLGGAAAKNNMASAALNQLQKLIASIKQMFPNHSLAFEADARLAVLNNQSERAIEQYLNVIERNGSDVGSFVDLAHLYRENRQYQKSFQLLNSAVSLAPHEQNIHYWMARDLLKLGYYARAKDIIRQQPAVIADAFDRLRFYHFNYDTLVEIFQAKLKIAAKDRDLRQVIASSQGLVMMPTANLAHEIERSSIDDASSGVAKWRYVSLLVAAKRYDQASVFIEQYHMAQIDFEDLAAMADQVYYLNYFANMLLATKQQQAAKKLLESLVKFFSEQPRANEVFSTQLAESYALLGKREKALDELAKVIAGGWMPDVRYDIANLRENPNLSTLNGSWQFRVLVELVENRQLLLRKLSGS